MTEQKPLPTPPLPPSPGGAGSMREGDDRRDPGPVLQKPGELGGRSGPEPTRFGDWEVDGRCTDF